MPAQAGKQQLFEKNRFEHFADITLF